MNGVMIVLMIAELILSVGLGLAIATIHSVLLKFMAAQNDLAMAAKGSRDRIKARVDKLETEQAKMKRSIISASSRRSCLTLRRPALPRLLPWHWVKQQSA